MRANLALVVLAVEDVGRAKSFYVDAFGWDVLVDLPVYVQLRMPGGAAIGLFQRESYGRVTTELPIACPAGASTATELYLQVQDREAAESRLLSAGARLLSPAALRDWGDTTAYFADPDGNVVAVFAEDDGD